jgi:hypothetical protein
MKTRNCNFKTARLKRRVQTLILILLGGLLWPSVSLAYLGLCCAHCGGNMPLNITGGGIPETHEFRFKLSQSYMNMGPMRNGTTDLNTQSLLGAPAAGKFLTVPSSMDMYMTMFSAAYSFTDDFALMVMSSYNFNFMDMEFGTILQGLSGQPGFTMESQGFGDTKLLGKYRLYSDDHLAPTDQFTTLLGLSLPSGSIDEKFTNNPAPNQNGTILPFKMQLGSGTVDPIFGLLYQGSTDPLWYGVNAMYTARLYDNSQGYQQGDEFRGDIYSMYQFHERSVLHLQFNAFWEDKYSDEPNAGKLGDGHVGGDPANPFVSPLFDPNNYGGTKVNITTGIQWQPAPLNVFELNGSVPIYQDLNGPQLKENYRIMLTWYIEIPTKKSRRFTGTKPPEELGF